VVANSEIWERDVRTKSYGPSFSQFLDSIVVYLFAEARGRLRTKFAVRMASRLGAAAFYGFVRCRRGFPAVRPVLALFPPRARSGEAP
jgi:hypothetical protein